MIRFLQTPGKAKKFFLSGMLLVICVAMVWYLVPQGNTNAFSGGANSMVLARVGDNDITYNDVQLLTQGRPMNPFLLQQALNYLIERDAQVMEAHRMGLEVSDAELKDELHQGSFGPVIFPEGKFVGEEKYTQFVQGQFNMTVENFEKLLKMQLLTQKLQQMVSSAVAVTPDEIRREFLKQNEKVKLEYAVISPAQVEKQINPSEAELKAYYEAHKAEIDRIIEQRERDAMA